MQCSATFSIYRIGTRYRYQFYGLNLYQEIGEKAIEDVKKRIKQA